MSPWSFAPATGTSLVRFGAMNDCPCGTVDRNPGAPDTPATAAWRDGLNQQYSLAPGGG